MEEKDLNYFINRASGLNQVDADNYFQTRGVQGEDYSFAMNTLAEKNPDFFGKKQKVKAPLINNANAVFSDDDNWWDKIAGSFAQGIDVSKENKRMSSLVNEGALGMEADDEEVRAFAESIDSVNSMELTPELQRYNELLAEKEALREEDDDGLFSEIIDSTRAIMDSWDEDGEINFGLIPQIYSQSMGAYATTENLLTVVGSTVAGAVAGAVTTSPTVVGMPVGLLAGAYSGFRLGSSIVGGIVEAQSATAELVMEQLEMRGLEYNETNLKTILNDDDAMFEVVKKGAARGLTIGAIEFITQGLAGKGVGVAKKAVGRGMVGNLAGVATAIGVEAVGGGVGEIAGSAAAGQDITGSDVVMESIGGTATAPISVLKGLISAPKYTQRGKKISGRMAQRLVDTATPEQLADMGLEIKNDPELSNTLDLKRSPVIARRKAIAANSDLLNRLSEKDGDNLIDLTIELEEQRKSKSPLGKKRVAELEDQIEEIVNNAPKEPETPDVSAEDSSGSEAPAPAKNTSTKKVVDNNSKPTASQNSEGERLSQYDESQDGLDGDIEDSANKSGYYTRRVKQGELKINSLNKRISAILTQVQSALAPDGGIGGPTALNEEQRQEYQSLLKERNSLEKQLSKDRASERAAKKASRPTISIDAEEKSNFVEVDSQNPDAGLSNPNMPTEFRSLLSNVLNKAVAKFRDKLPQVSIKVHRDIGSFNIAMRGADGSAMSKDNVTFGWYDSKKKQIHMLDVTNPEVRSAIKGFGDFNIDSVTDLVTEEVLFHFAMESVLSDSNVRSSFLNQLLDLALNNYRLRGVLSDRMFSYFPDGVKGMVKAAEGMPKLIRSIENVYIRNGEFTVSDIKALLAFVTDSKKKANIEEELIGGYVRDYIKSPDAYRNVWQKIADIINRLIGKNIINSEADLKGFARVLSRGIEGEEVQFTPGESQSGSPISKSTRSKREFTYLKDTEVFYTFDRQSGRESDFVATNSRGNYGVPQSIKVNDFFHFRNWYNKITANQEYPGIATEMYFIKDGKKHIVKPPKPQVDKNGKKVRIKRIPTFKELKGAARMRDQAIDSEVRVQYSELSKEVSDLWHESGLNVYTILKNFYPDGKPSVELDFEGLVIAKKNIQAAIDSGITKEQLKKLKGNRSSVSKEDNPDLFNMSGLSRVSSPEEHGTVHHLESRGLSFSKPTPRKSLPSKEGRKRISLKDLPVNGISLKYDVGATTEYTLKYGDNEYKFKTSGGVSEIAEYEGEGLSASHSTVDQRRTTLKMLKYFEVVLNDDLEDIESYLREPIEAKKKAIDNVKAKKKGGRLNTEEKKLIKNYEKEIKNFEDSIPSQIEEAKALKESLKNDKGLVTLYIHLNDPKSIVGRPQIFKDLGSLLFRAVETEDSIEFTDRLLKDISASIEAVPEAKKAFVGLYGQSALANPSLEVMEEFFKNENDDLAFQGRIDLILRLPMFKSKGDRGSRDKIYNGFPSLKNDLWRQVTDDYYWDNLNEFFVIDRESTSGYALNAMTVDLNKLFSGVNRSAIVKNKGTDFGYYIGGLDTVYDLDSIVSLDKSKSKDGKKEAAKDTYISRIEFEEVSSKKISRLKKELKNADPSKAQTIKSLKSQIKRLEESVAVTATATKRYGTPKSKESALYRDVSKAIGKGYRDGEISFSKTSGRASMLSRQTRSNVGNVGGAAWTQREQSSTDQFTDKWLVRLQDKYRRVFKLQEDVAKKNQGQIKETEDFRMAEERMYGRAANDLEILDNQTTKITEQLKEEGLSVSDVDEYMYALHAKERNAVISERTEGENTEGSGKSDEWADGILNSLSDEKKAKLEKVASTVREIQQDTRDKMVELGLETQETIDAFEEMFSDYVPLQGQAKDEDSIEFSPYPSGGAGFSVSGATTKKAKGRKTESADIVAQVISQNAAVSIKGRTNESMNALYNLVESNPNEDVWTILDKDKDGYKDLDPNIVSVRVNGVQKAIRFKDGSYAQSLRSMNLPQKNLFVKYMGTLNSWLRAAFTSRNPEFILSNFSRDIQSAIFNASAETDIEGGFLNGTGAMRRIFKMVSPSLKALIRDEVGAKADPLIIRYYNEFKEDGGKTGWAYQKSLEDIASELEIDDSGKTKSQGIIGGVKKGLEFIEGMNDAFENSIRLSAYIAAREGGVSRGKAAQFSKNITVNFNKQGEWGPAMNATFLFFNASIQGTARLGRSLTKLKPAIAPDGSTRNWRQRATNAQKAALGMVIMNGMLTLLNRAASDEDEDEVLFFNKIPDYVKERNMIIMRPDGENYWKIPMPYGYNIFANAGSVAVEVASGDKPALEGLAFMASTMINAFSPVSFGQSENLARMATKSAIPTAFKPFFDAFAFNETYFGSPVMAEQYPFGTPKPNSSMSFRSPEELKQFFSWMNEATGGSENVPGVVDINPDGGWYIMEYFMGGTGKFVERSIETARKTISDTTEEPVKLDFNDVPFMRIVYGEPSKYYDMQKFKDREVEVKQLMSELKGSRVKGDPDRYKGVANLNAKLKAINKQLRNIRSQKRAVRKISNYGERVSKVQALMEKERKLIMMFNKQYDKLRGED